MELGPFDSDDIQAIFALLTFVAAIAGWLVNRYVVRRRRLSYRVHWNRPIEVTRPHDARGIDLQIQYRRSLVSRPSLVILRVENVGSSDIDKSHVERPLTFGFGGRRVVHYEVQETEPRQLALQITEPAEGEGPRLLPTGDGPDRRLELPAFQLNRGDRFKLLVLLSGQGEDVDVDGWLTGGEIAKEGRTRPRSRTGLALGGAVLLFGGVLGGVLVTHGGDDPPPRREAVACPAAGTLGVTGSSALFPAVDELARSYRGLCPEANIQVEASGTTTAVDGLIAAGKLDDASGRTANSRVRLAMADEPAGAAARDPRLRYWPVGIGAFAIVVNQDSGMVRVTEGQLQRLWAGELPRWDDADLGGATADVVLVSRSPGSGTRATFEQRLLGRAESAPISSTDCLAKDKAGQQDAVMHCELDSTQALLDKVAATAGAIGYANLAEAEAYRAKGVKVLPVGGVYPGLATVADGSYRFWAVEKLYRWGAPIPPTVRDHFVGYVTTNAGALAALRDRGFYLCSDPVFLQGEVAQACGPDPVAPVPPVATAVTPGAGG